MQTYDVTLSLRGTRDMLEVEATAAYSTEGWFVVKDLDERRVYYSPNFLQFASVLERPQRGI